MRNVKLTIAYDGTDFHGWQVQSNKPTIQGALTDVLQRITQEKVYLYGAGRTDAGVHALGQVGHFKTQSGLSPDEFQRALNALLPPTIRVVAAEEVGPDFHARWQALAKTYRYRLYRGRVVPPAGWRYVLHYPFPLDLAAMRDACALYVGEHDFASFAASTGSEEDDSARTTVREIMRATLTEEVGGEELHFTVRGKSFLRYMVRKMVGTLLDMGRGKLQPADITRLYELRDRSKSGPTVPAHGLCLLSVEYPEPWRLNA
ncbi:MAG: tRNA pseudouridine(38-40) synthase TruA [Candidatus Acidiferrales bacterium]|jgi:tRNA pseudouridine38-40 synthase